MSPFLNVPRSCCGEAGMGSSWEEFRSPFAAPCPCPHIEQGRSGFPRGISGIFSIANSSSNTARPGTVSRGLLRVGIPWNKPCQRFLGGSGQCRRGTQRFGICSQALTRSQIPRAGKGGAFPTPPHDVWQHRLSPVIPGGARGAPELSPSHCQS